MNTLIQTFWPPALIRWKEPKVFKHIVTRARRQSSPVWWFVLTLGLPFAGGVCLMVLPFALGLLQGRPFVPSTPFTFVSLGCIFGALFALFALWLQYIAATISCYKHYFIVNTGGQVQRHEYKHVTKFEVITEVVEGQALRALVLWTNYGERLVFGLPVQLDLELLVQTLQSGGVSKGQIQRD